MGSVFFKVAGIGVTDQAVLGSIWRMYIIWFLVCLGIAMVPVIAVYARWRESFREFVLFEAGGFGLFSPLWLFLGTEMSGDSWRSIIDES